MLLSTSNPRATKAIPWLQRLSTITLFFAGVLLLVLAFSSLPKTTHPDLLEPHFEMSLSGAISITLILDSEDTTSTLSFEGQTIRFNLLPKDGLYGLSWEFTLPQGINRPSTFTLGDSYVLTLNLLSHEGIYRTFRASEGVLGFDPESKTGYFSAYFYDAEGEKVFGSARWRSGDFLTSSTNPRTKVGRKAKTKFVTIQHVYQTSAQHTASLGRWGM